MRQQALFLIAAVSLHLSAAAQKSPSFLKLNFAKSYDVANINKPVKHRTALNEASTNEKQQEMLPRLSPYLDLPSLKKQLNTDMQYLKLENRNKQWQGMFQGLMQSAAPRGKPGL